MSADFGPPRQLLQAWPRPPPRWRCLRRHVAVTVSAFSAAYAFSGALTTSLLQAFDAAHRRLLGGLLTLPQGRGVPYVVCSSAYSLRSGLHRRLLITLDPPRRFPCTCHHSAFTGCRNAMPLASDTHPGRAQLLPPWQMLNYRGGGSSTACQRFELLYRGFA